MRDSDLLKESRAVCRKGINAINEYFDAPAVQRLDLIAHCEMGVKAARVHTALLSAENNAEAIRLAFARFRIDEPAPNALSAGQAAA